MPAFDPTSVDEEAFSSPIWGAFALVKENVEWLVAINLIWSVHLIPLALGVGLWMWPLWLRLVLMLFGVIALAGATSVLYGLVEQVNRYEPLTMDMVRRTYQRLAVPGMLRLAPLYGTSGLVLLLLSLNVGHLFVINVLLGVALLWFVLCAMYWGPQFAQRPERSGWLSFRRSFYFVSRYPAVTLGTLLWTVGLAVIGVVSVGGLVLIVPVLIALLQTRRYDYLVAGKPARMPVD